VKISFPRMGNSYIGFKHLCEGLGFEVVVPPNPTQRTLTYGARYSPEFACMPFKVLTGTYVEVLEKGADVIISSGGIGPCRAGFYGVLHEKILKDLGYDFKFIIVDPPMANLKEFYNNVLFLKPRNLKWGSFLKKVRTAWKMLTALDGLDMLVAERRAYELNKGDTQKAFETAVSYIDSAETYKEVVEAEAEGRKLIECVPVDETRIPLRVGIVGEIYVVIEPFMNMDLERRLGELGVITHRSIYVTTYVRHTIWDRKAEDYIKDAARPYLKQMVGGHGINSVGETVLYGKDNYDGVVQLAPFTCIPEIVARSILPKVSKDYDIPVLTLHIDEQTGETGVQTRLEAFLDLLREKQKVLGECI
jgi:predicted nucleotide-binding protein (sugar kinase/HSP70/actin superfamily)